MKTKRGFASDNNAGVHQSIMQSILAANEGHRVAYGDDSCTQKAKTTIKKLFKRETEVFFVLTGTAANVLILNALADSFCSVFCADTAHINVDECGAPQKFTGMKLQSIPTNDGKLTVDLIQPYLYGFGDQHHSQPRIISISQPTELGTLYTQKEIKDLADYAHANKMFLHIDGARIANAVAAMQCTISEITEQCGVDALSFGGTKNGMMYGEAIVFFNKNLSENFKFYRKQGMQLASKMRYIAAQFIAFFQDDLWIKNANNANKMAKLLAQEVQKIEAVEITQKVEANSIFVKIPAEIITPLQKEYFFYVWNENTNEVRWMCSFDTQKSDIYDFTEKIKQLLQ